MEMWTRDLAASTGSIPRTRSIRLHVCHVSRVAPAGDHPARAEAESTMSPAGAGTVGGRGKKAAVLSYWHGEMPSSSVVITPRPRVDRLSSVQCPVSTVPLAEWLEWSGSEQTSITTHISPAQ